jgi:hypothetical protein
MLTRSAAAELFADGGVTVNSCHPGVVTSKLLQDLGMARRAPAQPSGSLARHASVLGAVVHAGAARCSVQGLRLGSRWRRDASHACVGALFGGQDGRVASPPTLKALSATSSEVPTPGLRAANNPLGCKPQAGQARRGAAIFARAMQSRGCSSGRAGHLTRESCRHYVSSKPFDCPYQESSAHRRTDHPPGRPPPTPQTRSPSALRFRHLANDHLTSNLGAV